VTAPRLLPPWFAPRVAVGLAAGVAVLAALPVVLDPYLHNLLTLTFLAVSGALAWNWMGGYLGQVSFGHAAFFGFGGFVAARILMHEAIPPWIAWVGGAAAAGAFSLGAYPILRLRGPYFSIATIGLGEAARIVFTWLEGFTGGASGLSLPIDPDLKARLYGWALGLLAVVATASYVLRRSTLGLELSAIKADVEAAADCGVPTALRQVVVLALSAAVAGATGGLSASYFAFVEPNDLFGFDRSISFVLMAVIGGVGTVFGPILGAGVFVALRQWLVASYPQLYLGLYGALLVLIILFEPLGLAGVMLRVARRFGWYHDRPDLAVGSSAARTPRPAGQTR